MMVWRIVEDPPYLVRVKTKVDWWGMGLLVAGLGALQTLLEQGEQYNWFDSKLNVAYAAIAVASLVMFIVWELTTDNPAVNLRVLKNRSLATGTAIGAVLGAVLFSTLFLLPIYMQEFLGYDAMQTGLALMPRSLVMLVTIPIVGAIYNRTSPRLVISFGLALGAFTCFQMSRFTLTTSHEEILWPQMIQGVALACIFIPLSTVALATIDRRRMGDATGLNNLVRQLGGSFGVAIFAALLDRYTVEARQGLVAHVTMGDPAVGARLAGMRALFTRGGIDAITASQRALAMLDGQVSLQASMLGFDRAFFLAGLVFAVSMPLVLLLDEGRKAAGKQSKQEHMAVEICDRMTTANPSTSVAAATPATEAAAPAKKGRARVIALGVLAAAAAGILGWYVVHAGLEDTDDAQVDADLASVPARIGGVVQKVLVTENQRVKAGDVLAEIDPAQAQARLAEAEAQLAADKAAADATDSDVAIIEATATGQKGAAEAALRGSSLAATATSDEIAQADAQVKQASVARAQAKTDFDRVNQLFGQGAVPRQQLDDGRARLDAAEAALTQAKARQAFVRAGQGKRPPGWPKPALA